MIEKWGQTLVLHGCFLLFMRTRKTRGAEAFGEPAERLY